MPGCPFRFTLYLLLFPLVGTNIPARYGWYHVDHTAPVPPVRWYVFQCKMSHSYHWSHSDTRYLLRYTAKVSRTAEIAPTGELPSGFARQYAGRLLDCPLDDPDALDALLRGTHIVEYNLHTNAYYLKGTRIPGFVGSAVVDAHLSLPLLEVWNALLAFAPYGGIGIKTALGMGGAEVMTLTEKEH